MLPGPPRSPRVLVKQRVDDRAGAFGAHLERGGAQDRARSLDHSQADGPQEGRLPRTDTVPAPECLEGRPIALGHQQPHGPVPSKQQRGDQQIGKRSGERLGIPPRRMDGRDQVRAGERRRSAGLERIVGVVHDRSEPIIPGDPQQIGELGKRFRGEGGFSRGTSLVGQKHPAGRAGIATGGHQQNGP